MKCLLFDKIALKFKPAVGKIPNFYWKNIVKKKDHYIKEQLNTFEWPHKSEKGIPFVTYFDRILEKGKIHDRLVLFTLNSFQL